LLGVVGHMQSNGGLLFAYTIGQDNKEPPAIASNEFAVRPMVKASTVRTSCSHLGSVAAYYGKESAVRLMISANHIHACQIGQFGVHKCSLKNMVNGLDKSVLPVVIGFLYTAYMGIKLTHGLNHAVPL